MMSVIVSVLLIAGLVLSVVSAVGIHRLKDPYTRLHATSTVNSLGLICFMLASVFYFMGGSASYSLRQLLTILFLFSTVPAGVHILSRAAVVRNVGLWRVRGSVTESEKRIIEAIQQQSEKRRALRQQRMREDRARRLAALRDGTLDER